MKIRVLALLVAVLITGIGFWFSYSNNMGENDLSASLSGINVVSSSQISGRVVDPEAIAEVSDPPKGFIKYSNTKYGFSFYHAPEAVTTEYDEGGGAMTITLENLSRVRGMQIFIVPYAEDKITEERFLADVPSGVRENVEKTTVGKLGIEAVTFTSRDKSLGDTRELWFIYKGYLYEVTTFKGVGAWFEPIIQTWRFSK